MIGLINLKSVGLNFFKKPLLTQFSLNGQKLILSSVKTKKMSSIVLGDQVSSYDNCLSISLVRAQRFPWRPVAVFSLSAVAPS